MTSAASVARLLTVDDLAGLPAPSFLLEHVLQARAHNVVFGPSGSGKTFAALDWNLCIATGRPWFGQEVEQGPVVYIAAEGAMGLFGRIKAWQVAHDVAEVKDFYVFPEAVNFYADQADALTAAIDALEEPPVLITVDTVARCMAGGDENAARDMGLFIERVDALRRRYEAAVLLIHHTGKNGELERGSSALRGAADTMVSLKPDGAGLKLTCEKQKDSAPFDPWYLHLTEVGESCVLRLGTDSRRLSPPELQILEAVSARFGTDWVSASKVAEVADVPKSSLYRGLKSLVERGRLEDRPVGKQRKEYRVAPQPVGPSQTVPSRPAGTSETVPSHTPLLGGGTGTDRVSLSVPLYDEVAA
jgi:hypothetical protein